MEAIEKLLLEVNDDGQICERHILNLLSALAVAGSYMTQKVLSNFITKQGDLQHAGPLGYSRVCARELIEAAQRVSNPSELLFDTIFSFASQPVRSYESAHQKQIRTIAILTLGSLGRSSRDFSGRNTLLWNRLATPQDTHDQESNAPSAPLAKCTGFGCARD
jgi:hypothetical protein